MWIAKPINALSPEEKAQWLETAKADLPLSQTLRWARAAASVGARAWLIFSPDEKVGGTVLELDEPGVLECINGPHLNWDNSEQVARQLATFAVSASKIAPAFRSLKIRPRWDQKDSQKLLQYVPIEATSSVEASTLVVPLLENEEKLWNNFHPRLQRTLKTAMKERVQAEWIAPTPENIHPFVESMKEFSKTRGFYVPAKKWFDQILADSDCEKVEFGIVQAKFPDEKAQAEILIAIYGNMAHYLFGWEKRAEGARGALSPSAWAHFTAMKEAKARGAEAYDFNGFIRDVASNDPYAGVCKFKAQWGGEVKTFLQPEYFIE